MPLTRFGEEALMLETSSSPKHSDIFKICYNYPNIWTKYCRQNGKQWRPWSDCSGSTLFAHTCLSENLHSLQVVSLRDVLLSPSLLDYVSSKWVNISWKAPQNSKTKSMPQLNSIWAASWQNQRNDCAPSEDTDQPWHPPSLIRFFAVRSMGI